MLPRDIRYALRRLRKSQGFTITVVVTLALGIGTNTAIFTLFQGIVLRRLPVKDPGQLYRIGDTVNCGNCAGFPNDNGDFDAFSYDLYLRLRDSGSEFEQLAAVQTFPNSLTVRRAGMQARQLQGQFVSGNFFVMLGIQARAGRLLIGRDDAVSADPVVVISNLAWHSEFASDPSLVGSTIYIESKPYSVVGIAPPGFYGDRVSTAPPDFWVPLGTEPYLQGANTQLHVADENWLYAIGRLHPGSQIGSLQSKLSIVLRQWLETRPAYTANGGAQLISKQHVVITSAAGGIQQMQQGGAGAPGASSSLTMLMILSGFILLIACANVANLWLARATARRTEIASRMALGSSRGRIVREIFIESLLLSWMGGLVGLAVASATANAILAFVFPNFPNLTVSANPSPPVLIYAFLASLATGVFFGVAPAWLASHAHPAEVLRSGARSMRGRSTVAQKALVVTQVALSVVLIVGAILMTKTLRNLEHQDFGVTTHNRYVFFTDTQGAGYTSDRLPGLYREIEDRFSGQPGVANVGIDLASPLGGGGYGAYVSRPGQPVPGPNCNCVAFWDRVNEGYLDSVGVPVVMGRKFSTADTQAAPSVALVNETFAKFFFPNQNPIGKRFGIYEQQTAEAIEVVGVFADYKTTGLRQSVLPTFLRPLPQRIASFKDPVYVSAEEQNMYADTVVLDFDATPQNVGELIRRTMAGVDPNLTVTQLQTLDEYADANFLNERIVANLSTLFAVLALTLASVGLYGVMSYIVTLRTGEIGIRMALGATRASVTTNILRGAMGQIAIGLAIGVPGALYINRLLGNLLYGVVSYDPFAIAGAVLVLGLCATAAGFVPARKAASIEPMRALRME